MYIKHNYDAHFCYYLNGPINQYGITETQLSMTAKLQGRIVFVVGELLKKLF